MMDRYFPGGLRWRCEPAAAHGATNVILTWNWRNVDRHATYVVLQSGQVAPADGNAAQLEQVAALGPLAIQYLIK